MALIAKGREDTHIPDRRILVVEDETLVAILIEEALIGGGYQVVGPAGRIAQAEDMARTAEVEGAVLDINVHGEPVYPVAAILAGRGIPFLFVTGYSASELTAPFKDRPLLRKPFTADDLRQAIGQMVEGATVTP